MCRLRKSLWVHKIIENRCLFNINRVHCEIMLPDIHTVRLPAAWNSFRSPIFVSVWKQVVMSSAHLIFLQKFFKKPSWTVTFQLPWTVNQLFVVCSKHRLETVTEPMHALPSMNLLLWMAKLWLCISQGSVATVLKWGGQNHSHLRQVLHDVPCQKLFKSANVSWSYSKKYHWHSFFWDTVYKLTFSAPVCLLKKPFFGFVCF